MHRNYCFRHKRHSYAACDAALAASMIILNVGTKDFKLYGNFDVYIYILENEKRNELWNNNTLREENFAVLNLKKSSIHEIKFF